MTKLSVNVNKIALLRNTRTIGIPSVVRAAEICLDAGAAGITVHPRPDERHIRASDVFELLPVIERFKKSRPVEFNIEGNPLEGRFFDIVRRACPDQVTLVPDSPDQSTSDHGWDLEKNVAVLTPIVAELKALGCRVSLFVDYDTKAMKNAKVLGADRVELYTEPYAAAASRGQASSIVHEFARAAAAAKDAGLGVNAGHDLNLLNLGIFLRNVPNVLEVSIGHALVAEALEMGLAAVVRAYEAVILAAVG